MFSLRRLGRLDPLEAGCGLPGGGLLEHEVRIGAQGSAGPCVPLSRFSQNVVITGQPGMRKTTLASCLIEQLVEGGVGVVVLEPAKTEYAANLRGRVPLVAYGEDGGFFAERLRVNPFAVDASVRPAVWLEDVSNAIVDSFGMAEQPLPLHLQSLIRAWSREKGIPTADPARGSESWPTMKDFLMQIGPYIEKETCSGKEVEQNIHGALVKRGRSMAEIPALCAARGILASDLVDAGGVTVLQLSDIGPNSGLFAGMVLLLRMIRSARALGGRPLHTVVVLEEAHSLLVDAMTGEPTMFSRVYESALAELRASGIGFVTIDQRPSLLPSGVLANSVTKIAFASTHGEDRSAMGMAMGLSEAQIRRFGGLREGEALFSTVGIEGAEVATLCR